MHYLLLHSSHLILTLNASLQLGRRLVHLPKRVTLRWTKLLYLVDSYPSLVEKKKTVSGFLTHAEAIHAAVDLPTSISSSFKASSVSSRASPRAIKMKCYDSNTGRRRDLVSDSEQSGSGSRWSKLKLRTLSLENDHQPSRSYLHRSSLQKSLGTFKRQWSRIRSIQFQLHTDKRPNVPPKEPPPVPPKPSFYQKLKLNSFVSADLGTSLSSGWGQSEDSQFYSSTAETSAALSDTSLDRCPSAASQISNSTSIHSSASCTPSSTDVFHAPTSAGCLGFRRRCARYFIIKLLDTVTPFSSSTRTGVLEEEARRAMTLFWDAYKIAYSHTHLDLCCIILQHLANAYQDQNDSVTASVLFNAGWPTAKSAIKLASDQVPPWAVAFAIGYCLNLFKRQHMQGCLETSLEVFDCLEGRSPCQKLLISKTSLIQLHMIIGSAYISLFEFKLGWKHNSQAFQIFIRSSEWIDPDLRIVLHLLLAISARLVGQFERSMFFIESAENSQTTFQGTWDNLLKMEKKETMDVFDRFYNFLMQVRILAQRLEIPYEEDDHLLFILSKLDQQHTEMHRKNFISQTRVPELELDDISTSKLLLQKRLQRLTRRHPVDHSSIAIIYGKLGDACMRECRYEAAKTYYESQGDLCRARHDSMGVFASHLSLGGLYKLDLRPVQFKNAFVNLERSYVLSTQMEYPLGQVQTLLELAHVAIHLSHYISKLHAIVPTIDMDIELPNSEPKMDGAMIFEVFRYAWKENEEYLIYECARNWIKRALDVCKIMI